MKFAGLYNVSILLAVVCTLTITGCKQKTPPGTASTTAQPSRVTVRDFLETGRNESEGYGLYSYILLLPPASDEDKERNKALVSAYVTQLLESTTLETSLGRPQLNITYLPITEKAPDKPTPDWIIAHYDFPRATVFLHRISGTSPSGAYIISTREPLSKGTENLTAPYLYQDLSNAKPKIMPLWLRVFETQAAKPEFWKPDWADQLVANLRNDVAAAADFAPIAKDSITAWIKWVK